MIFESFPIEGPLKEPLLIMEWLIVFLFFEVALIFWIRVKIKKKELKSLQEKAYIWIFLGYSLMWVFIIIADFYLESGANYIRNVILNIGFFIQVLCALIFLFIMEKYKIFIKKFLFTKIFLILLVIYIPIIFFALEIASKFFTIFWIVFILFFSMYLKEIYHDFYLKRELGKIKKDFIKFIIGIFLIIVGYQLSTRIIAETLGLEYRLLGDIFQLIGLGLIIWCLISVPSFSEIDWHDKIEKLFVMYKSGLFLYKKSFKEIFNDIDESIITGTLATLKLMIEKITEHEGGTLTIEKKEKVIIIQPGKFIFGVIISDENLLSLQILLSKFIEKIETIYYKVLKQWDGNLKVFKPLDDIVKEIFY